VRVFVLPAVAVAVVTAAVGLSAGVAQAMLPPEDSAQPAAPVPRLIVTPTLPSVPPTLLLTQPAGTGGGGGGGSSQAPAGCRDVDISTSQKSALFHTKIYKFHQLKHWCWRRGVVYDERHAWSFDGGSTACFDTTYPDNHWTFSWNGKPAGGDFSEERAHVTNCVFHIGDWKEYYPDVKIWAYADGTYKVEKSN
jgi:hypothetical protein